MIFARRIDLPFSRDVSTHYLPWIIAFLSFIASLCVAGFLMLAGFSAQWTTALESALTVEVDAREGEAAEEMALRTERTVNLLLQTEGVDTARSLPLDQVQSYLEPWLGAAVDIADLPLPRLIDVRLAGNASIDLGALNERLAAFDARADDHGEWRQDLLTFLLALQLLALGVAIVVIASGVAMVAFAIRGSLATHRQSLELLHLMGARDNYIMRQFQTVIARLALKGSIPGSLVAVVLLILTARAGKALEVIGDAVPAASGGAGPLLAALAVPPLIVLVAIIVTRRTVKAALRKMA